MSTQTTKYIINDDTFINMVKRECEKENKNYETLYIRREGNELLAGSDYEGSNTFVHYDGLWYVRESWSGEDRLYDNGIYEHTMKDVAWLVADLAWFNE